MRVIRRRRTTERFSTEQGASPQGVQTPTRIWSLPDRSNFGGLTMKTIKSLVLGSAAALLAMSGAQAADLPVKAKAIEYVRICSLYGAGFFYIPGTETCIKLGGYLRADTVLNSNGIFGSAYNGVAGAQNRYRNYYSTRSREDLSIDTRT